MSVKFENLIGCDLHLDEVYEGGNKNNVSDDVISKILKTGNSGGFRIRGKTEPFKINYCALCSSLADQDWPDSIDVHNGIFTYFGDNRKPGPILNTKNKGNLILEESFLYEFQKERKNIPLFLYLRKKELDGMLSLEG